MGPDHVPNGQTYGTNRVDVIGRVSSIAIDPSNTKHILLGSAGGGIWESKDLERIGRRAQTRCLRSRLEPSFLIPATGSESTLEVAKVISMRNSAAPGFTGRSMEARLGLCRHPLRLLAWASTISS